VLEVSHKEAVQSILDKANRGYLMLEEADLYAVIRKKFRTANILWRAKVRMTFQQHC
jgi:hypothetical protein